MTIVRLLCTALRGRVRCSTFLSRFLHRGFRTRRFWLRLRRPGRVALLFRANCLLSVRFCRGRSGSAGRLRPLSGLACRVSRISAISWRRRQGTVLHLELRLPRIRIVCALFQGGFRSVYAIFRSPTLQLVLECRSHDRGPSMFADLPPTYPYYGEEQNNTDERAARTATCFVFQQVRVLGVWLGTC